MPEFTSYFNCEHKLSPVNTTPKSLRRNPCFPDNLTCPRIFSIELLKQLPKHLERYKDAFPELLLI
ncbi:hypothetical protein BDR05DRAFT_960740 [Suillus weaverae]|nr:hypothetical protein BDR05DRAFT_960740 [Suillus weaverae]